MRLLEKYEILELLASGNISTFLARDRTTQDEVVVHSFECPSSAAGETRDRTIFKRFSSIAPALVGRVLDVGLDEATALAYIVIQVPLPAALQDWIRNYRTNNTVKPSSGPENAAAKIDAAEDAAEKAEPVSSDVIGQTLSAEPPASQAAEPLPVADFTSVVPKGEFTKLFEGAGYVQPERQQDGPSSATGAIASDRTEDSLPCVLQPEGRAGEKLEANPAVSNSAGFTELFVLGRKDGPVLGKPGSPVLDEPAKSAPEYPGEFTLQFLANAVKPDPAGDEPNNNFNPAKQPGRILPDFSASTTYGLSTHAEGPSDHPKSNTSDFTNFFRGPFDQPSVPSKLDPSFSALAPKEKSVGEFTKIFGSPDSQQQEFEGSEPHAPPSPVGDFTKLFSRDDEQGTQLGLTSRLNADASPALQMLKPAPLVEPRQISPAFSLENKSSTLAPPPLNTGQASGTTNFGPPILPIERGSANPRGSVFPDATEVFKPPQYDDSFSPEAPRGPSDFTQFINRSQVDASLSKKSPLPPPTPRSRSKPPAPASLMPKPPKEAAAAASYWPLITVLTVLIAIGAMLVMYFVMRH
jgi:hypothetical protein